MTYFQKLKDPRWQRLWLEKMACAGYACEICGNTTKTLNIHHKAYIRGAHPWEYSDDQLECLCEDCHTEDHALRDRLNELLSRLPTYAVMKLVGYCSALALECEALPPSLNGVPKFNGIEEIDGYASGLLNVIPNQLADWIFKIVKDGTISDTSGRQNDLAKEIYLHALKHWDGPTLGPVVKKKKKK